VVFGHDLFVEFETGGFLVGGTDYVEAFAVRDGHFFEIVDVEPSTETTDPSDLVVEIPTL